MTGRTENIRKHLSVVQHAQAIVAAWHKKLIAGLLPRPSPTIAIALAAGYGHFAHHPLKR
jgi:hypothetical protein